MGMKVKKIEVKIEPESEFFARTDKFFRNLDSGKTAKRKETISFQSLDMLRKVLTQRRLELMHVIRRKKPESLYELAKLVNRDLKSVRTDAEILEALGLLELKKSERVRKVVVPEVRYGKLNVAISF